MSCFPKGRGRTKGEEQNESEELSGVASAERCKLQVCFGIVHW